MVMKRLIKILIVVCCIGLSHASLFAQEKGNASPIVALSKDVKAKLKTGAKIAIFLSGNEPILTRLIEDALSIYLTNAGFTPINREKLEKGIGEQVIQKRKEKIEGAINALEVGKIVNSDSIITGTIIMESGEQKSIVVKIASFQLVDVASEKTLLSFLSEPEKGKSLLEMVKGFVDILKQNVE